MRRRAPPGKRAAVQLWLRIVKDFAAPDMPSQIVTFPVSIRPGHNRRTDRYDHVKAAT